MPQDWKVSGSDFWWSGIAYEMVMAAKSLEVASIKK